jgi:hypothetical protein
MINNNSGNEEEMLHTKLFPAGSEKAKKAEPSV